VLDRGRLVVQDQLDALRGPTGRTIVRTPDTDLARSLLAARSVAVDADRLVVQDPDVPEVVHRLVTGGARVHEVTAERRTLEQVVLQASAGGDRAGAP
jgi:ABC-2 type transport system ATP-binding protein